MHPNCLSETLALVKDGMRLHNGIAEPLRKGCSTEPLAGVVILEWDEQPPTALGRALDGPS